MILLIGGSSHVGKTLITQKLIEKFHYSATSLDHLKMAFIRTGRTDLTVNDDYDMRFFLWSFAAEMVKTAIENDQNMILEGCYIPGTWKESFTPDYLKHIGCVFIVMSEQYLRSHFDEVTDFASVIEKRLDDHPDLERLIQCSKDFKDDAIKNDIPFIEIDENYNLENLVAEVCRLTGGSTVAQRGTL